jgi:cytochrome c oxidase subunit 2
VSTTTHETERSSARGARARGLVALGLAVVVLAGCGPGLPTPSTRQAHHAATLWKLALAAAAAVGLVTMGFILWAAFRYRRREDALPNQRNSHLVLEVVCTVIPVVIVAGLFAFTLGTERRMTRVSDDPDLVVDVVAFQWGWTFTYPDKGVVSASPEAGEPAVLALPVGSTVRLNLHAADVIHSFWVPQFLEKRDVIPRFDNTIDVNVTREGEWTGRCAEFCGLDHWEMNFDVKALSPADFQRWLDDERAHPPPTTSATAAAGTASPGSTFGSTTP